MAAESPHSLANCPPELASSVADVIERRMSFSAASRASYEWPAAPGHLFARLSPSPLGPEPSTPTTPATPRHLSHRLSFSGRDGAGPGLEGWPALQPVSATSTPRAWTSGVQKQGLPQPAKPNSKAIGPAAVLNSFEQTYPDLLVGTTDSMPLDGHADNSAGAPPQIQVDTSETKACNPWGSHDDKTMPHAVAVHVIDDRPAQDHRSDKAHEQRAEGGSGGECEALLGAHNKRGAHGTSSSASADGGGRNSQQLETEEPWWRSGQLRTALAGYGSIAFLFNFLEELTPIFASAPISQVCQHPR